MSIIQVFIITGGNRHSLILRSDSKVQELIKIFCTKYYNAIEPGQIELVFKGETLNYMKQNEKGQPVTLKDVNIASLSILHVAFLHNNADFIEMTTAKENPDVYSFEDGCDPERAIMPCGHAISQESLKEYSSLRVKNGYSTVICPECSEIWQWYLVKRVACFSSEELEEIDRQLVEITKNIDPSYNRCPECKNWVKRSDGSIEVFECWFCKDVNGKLIRFCWSCLSIVEKSTNVCPKNCKNKTDFILKNCPTKEIKNNEKSPAIRSCPKCKKLIKHQKGCKHMTCLCGCQFCFVCLKTVVNENWYDHQENNCLAAPRHTRDWSKTRDGSQTRDGSKTQTRILRIYEQNRRRKYARFLLNTS